jgi:glucose/arabinose dehydrogenase
MVRQGFLGVTAVALASTVAACIVALIGATRPVEAAVALPVGFEDRLVATVRQPTALTPTPDGRLLLASKPGRLRVLEEGTPGKPLALDISERLCSNFERGLLGVAVDPNFSTNRYVYLYYTSIGSARSCPTLSDTTPYDPETFPVNRVSRFTMSGDTVDPSTEKILIDNIPSPSGNHNAGDLHFGKDDYLYVSVGDGGCDYANDSGCQGQNDASRDTNVLLGKILRVTRDGDIPSTNPYTGTNSARCSLSGRTDPGKYCQETFASGLRNPFRFAFDPDAYATRFFIGDVGEEAWEEVDQGEVGADYGWNLCEGTHDNPFRPASVDCTAAPYTPPVHEYGHADTGCSSITGQAFVPDDASWPTSYNGSYLFGDFVCNKIFELVPKEEGGFAMEEFASGLGGDGPIAMAFGPYGSGQALYYTTYANGGEIHAVVYGADPNQAPTSFLNTTSPN